MRALNDSRVRAVLFGAIGGAIGSLMAEALLGVPKSLNATIAFGCVTGLGIGTFFGIAEGVGAGIAAAAIRAATIGGILGIIGGGVGSGLGQAVTSAGSDGGGVFTAEMAKRLEEAGAKRGEIEIGLIWRNRNDIDLHVLDPAGDHVFFGQRRSSSGGELDVDRNASCGNTTVHPVEHIVWEKDPPHGQYKVGVHYFARCSSDYSTPFDVEIGYGGQRLTLTGTVAAGDQMQIVKEFSYPPPKPGGLHWKS